MKLDIGERLLLKHPDAIPGDDFIFNQDEEIIEHWNEEKLGPKPGSIQELDAQTSDLELQVHQDRKIKELATEAVASLTDEFPDGGTDEAVYVLAMHVKQIADALGITVDPRITAVTDTAGKALGKKEQVLNATTVDEVNFIGWD